MPEDSREEMGKQKAGSDRKIYKRSLSREREEHQAS